MLYEFLTGTLPLGAWSPPSQKVEIDVRLDEVVLRALQENPAERYQSASEFMLDVDWIKVSSGGGPLPAGVEPEPLPSSLAGGALARRRQTPAIREEKAASLPLDPQSTELILETTRGLNTTTLILGLVALLTIGALAFFLANRKTGDTYNSENSATSTETNNSYVTQLFTTGPGAKELESFAEIHRFGVSYAGISREPFTFAQAGE